MCVQAAIKLNPLLRNGAYGIVMRGVQKCTRGCSSLRGRNRLPLCCIKLDTASTKNKAEYSVHKTNTPFIHLNKYGRGLLYG